MNYTEGVKNKTNKLWNCSWWILWTELSSKILKQIAFIKIGKTEEHLSFVRDKSTHQEQLSQPLQTNNKKFKIAVTFLFGYTGIFNIATRYVKFNFRVWNNDKDFNQTSIPPVICETKIFRQWN